MAKITISDMVPQEVKLLRLDKTGETKVWINPPSWRDDKMRGAMLSNRRHYIDEMNRWVVQVDCNVRELWEMEIWLSFSQAYIDVDIAQQDGNIKTVTIVGSKSDFTYEKFMKLLSEMPPQIIYAWHEAVVNTVPEWRDPF